MLGKTHKIIGISITLGLGLPVLVAPVVPGLSSVVSGGSGGNGSGGMSGSIDFGSLAGYWLKELAQIVLLVVTGWIAGQLPDCDKGETTISNSGKAAASGLIRYTGVRSYGLFGIVINAVGSVLNIIPQTVSWLANRYLGGHRGGVHSGIAIIIVFGATWGLVQLLGGLWGLIIPSSYWYFALIVALAYASHLIVDSFNPTGIPWLWPLTGSRKYHFLPKAMQFYSDSFLPNLVMQVVSILIVGIAFILHFGPGLTGLGAAGA